jgi:hypothetical protein
MVSASALGARRNVVNVLLRDSIDLDDLRSRTFASDNSNRAPSDGEGVCELFDQLVVRRAFNGRSRQAHLERVPMQSGDLGARSAWLNVNREPDSSAHALHAHGH